MDKIIYNGQELLPVTSDIVFKAIFGSEDNKDLLLSLLNSFIDLDIKSTNQIELVGTELIKHYSDDKLSRLDIRVKTENNKHVDVEIQVIDKKDMINRSLFYLASLYTEQMKEGMKYKNLGRTITLNILCFNLLLDEKSYINSYRFMNRTTNNELTDMMELNFVELPKVRNLQLDNIKNLWAKFLSAESEEELRVLAQTNETINKAVQTLKYVSADDIIRFEYDQRRKARLDYASDMANARDEGIEKGKIEGEKKKAIDIAKNLLSMHLSKEQIREATKLSDAEIEKLF